MNNKQRKCIKCGKSIGLARLNAVPDTNICAKCVSGGRVDDEFIDWQDKIAEILSSENDTEKTSKLQNILSNMINDIRESRKQLGKDAKQQKKEIEEQVRQKLTVEKDKLLKEKQDFESYVNKQLQELTIKEEEKQSYDKTTDKIKTLTKQLNQYFIKTFPLRIKNNDIIMFINPNIITKKSPDIKGFTKIQNIVYEVNIWTHKNSSGLKYWTGFLNKIGILTPENTISFHVKQPGLFGGNITFETIKKNIFIVFKTTSFKTTGLKYLEGQISFE